MYEILGSGFLAFVVYWNTLSAGFAYDDSRAIQKNPDLLPTTPWTNIWKDDFWGTPLSHTGSHKSYRPLCTVSFRLNYVLGELDPFSYHLVNVLLHCLVTTLVTYTYKRLLKRSSTAGLAGVLFACHPIHTEAVAGVVGRADVGAALFFILSFLFYTKYCELRDGSKPLLSNIFWMLLSILAAGMSMLTKEQGLTVLAVNLTFDLFIHHKIPLSKFGDVFLKKKYFHLRQGILSQVIAGVVFLSLRLYITGSSPPSFSPSDNPAADSDDLMTRTLTFLFLPVMNFWLLVCPYTLSFDWSMGAVPLVETIFDWRNFCSLTFYGFLVVVAAWILNILSKIKGEERVSDVTSDVMKHINGKCSSGELNGNSVGNGFHSKYYVNGKSTAKGPTYRGHKLNNGLSKSKQTNHHQSAINCSTRRGDSTSSSPTHVNIIGAVEKRTFNIIIAGLSFLIFPFLPATNLFLYVGFVIAERILYIPSIGFCLLLAFGIERLMETTKGHKVKKFLASFLVLLLISAYSTRTVLRNQDWLSEETLYRSGIAINPPKAWGNLANILKMEGKIAEAEVAYRNALKHRSNMADVHYNLGILLQESQRFEEAIESYQKAIHFRPRLSMAHLNLGIVLSEVGRVKEAELTYRHATTLTDDGLKDPRNQMRGIISSMFNLGRLLQDQGRYQEALGVYQTALERRPDFYAPQSLYNMLGETYFHLHQLKEAEFWYKKSLEAKPDHVPAHLTYANLLSKTNRGLQAENLLKEALVLDPSNANVYRHYGQLLNERGRHKDAASYYQKAFDLKPDDFEIAFNLANALRQAGDSEAAEFYYWKASELKPDEAHTHMNLGAILHMNNKLEEAEKSYLRALEIEPEHETTSQNLRKLRTLMKKRERDAR
ncbi:Transmembrane and TPR repeat-containing protein 2 [Holothuria leucospilota]|uniref:dolichyl-phosphate-mannose--protein mannosyltransferase n=1 Tax=Holothuria leucospilota TaxID=206669 RepID=A0A9Q1BSI8_HOLLE|nr:Transmembrane and TPR repeat-containing protein 2 [Holothuria leucospilota]